MNWNWLANFIIRQKNKTDGNYDAQLCVSRGYRLNHRKWLFNNHIIWLKLLRKIMGIMFYYISMKYRKSLSEQLFTLGILNQTYSRRNRSLNGCFSRWSFCRCAISSQQTQNQRTACLPQGNLAGSCAISVPRIDRICRDFFTFPANNVSRICLEQFPWLSGFVTCLLRGRSCVRPSAAARSV